MIYEVGKTFKIEDFAGIFYTATITNVTETHIYFKDRDGLANQLALSEIKRSKEVEQ